MKSIKVLYFTSLIDKIFRCKEAVSKLAKEDNKDTTHAVLMETDHPSTLEKA
jgi:hypothetical protein